MEGTIKQVVVVVVVVVALVFASDRRIYLTVGLKKATRYQVGACCKKKMCMLQKKMCRKFYGSRSEYWVKFCSSRNGVAKKLHVPLQRVTYPTSHRIIER